MEVRVAASVGVERQLQSMHMGLHEKVPGIKCPWEINILGALGECAYCKFRAHYWNFSVNTFKNIPDVGCNVQIRTTAPNLRLIVRPEDPSDQYFVHIRGECPTYEVVGWILGKDAKQPGWLEAVNGRSPAYFVPDNALTPFKLKAA